MLKMDALAIRLMAWCLLSHHDGKRSSGAGAVVFFVVVGAVEALWTVGLRKDEWRRIGKAGAGFVFAEDSRAMSYRWRTPRWMYRTCWGAARNPERFGCSYPFWAQLARLTTKQNKINNTENSLINNSVVQRPATLN